MKDWRLAAVGLVGIAGLAFWLTRCPSDDDVKSLQGKFVRAICETDIVEYYEEKVGPIDIQKLVGPISAKREEVFVHTRWCLREVGVEKGEERSYRKIVGCNAQKIRAFDGGVIQGVQASCPDRASDLLPNVVTLLGVVAQMEGS